MYNDHIEDQQIVQPSYMHEMYAAEREMKEHIYTEQQDAKRMEELKNKRERQEYAEQFNNYVNEGYAESLSRAEKLDTIRNAFVAECIYKVCTESMVAPATSRDKNVLRNLVNAFVKENGAIALLREFRTKNYVLSEFARICDKYYDRVLENCDECPEVKLDTTVSDDFFADLKDVDTSDASELIRDKVADSITEFIDSNMDARLEYEELLRNAKDQSSVAKTEAAAMDILNNAEREIIESRNSRYKSLMGYMVESLAKKAITDDSYKKIYVKEDGKLDMDSIVSDVETVYTMLETVNTLNITPMDENAIKQYIKSL